MTHLWQRVIDDHPTLRPHAAALWNMVSDRCPANRAEGVMSLAVVLMVRAYDTRHARPLRDLLLYLSDWRLPCSGVRRVYRGLLAALEIGERL